MMQNLLGYSATDAGLATMPRGLGTMLSMASGSPERTVKRNSEQVMASKLTEAGTAVLSLWS